MPGINSSDLHVNEHGVITVQDWIAKAIAERMLSIDHAEVLTIPVFEAVLDNAGEIAAVSFKLKGERLTMENRITAPENLRLLKVLSADSGEWFSYTDTAAELDDMKYTVLDMNGNIFTGNFAPDDDYKLLILIKDGGEFDLDRIEDGTVWDPMALVTIPVTDITLTPATLTLTIGDSIDLSPGVGIIPPIADRQSVTWISHNTEAATVTDAGLVTAIGAGTAIISVIAHDGGFVASCYVTVNPVTVPVTGVTISPKSMSLEVGETRGLTANITPTNATNMNVTWSSGNTTVAGVNETGDVTGIAVGTATITVTTENGNYADSCTVTVTNGNIISGDMTEQQYYENKYPGKTVVILPDENAYDEANGDTVVVGGNGDDWVDISHGGNTFVYNRDGGHDTIVCVDTEE
jgi:hypothetical protein